MKVDVKFSFPQALFCFLEQDRKYYLIIGRGETKKGRDGIHILKNIMPLFWSLAEKKTQELYVDYY